MSECRDHGGSWRLSEVDDRYHCYEMDDPADTESIRTALCGIRSTISPSGAQLPLLPQEYVCGTCLIVHGDAIANQRRRAIVAARPLILDALNEAIQAVGLQAAAEPPRITGIRNTTESGR